MGDLQLNQFSKDMVFLLHTFQQEEILLLECDYTIIGLFLHGLHHLHGAICLNDLQLNQFSKDMVFLLHTFQQEEILLLECDYTIIGLFLHGLHHLHGAICLNGGGGGGGGGGAALGSLCNHYCLEVSNHTIKVCSVHSGNGLQLV